jgi:hypothetical protein
VYESFSKDQLNDTLATLRAERASIQAERASIQAERLELVRLQRLAEERALSQNQTGKSTMFV